MSNYVFIAGPTAIGKRTLANILTDPAQCELRTKLGIHGRASNLGYATTTDDLLNADPSVTGIVIWQGMADDLLSEVSERLTGADSRLLILWRPFATHWRAYRDKTIDYGSGFHPDAHAADWMELCLTHRKVIYEMLASHHGIKRFILDAGNGYAELDSLPGDSDPFTNGVRSDLAHLVAEASKLGLPGTDGAWLPYSSFTLPGFIYDRTYRDTRQRLEWFGIPADLSGTMAVELASHCGAISLELANRGANVLGLEREAPSVAVANELAKALGMPARFREFNADLDAYPSESFDVVFCGSLDHWINERDLLYRQVVRLTRGVCYFESNEITRHEWLDAFFAEHFASVEVLSQSPGNRRLYVLKKS